MYMRNCDDTLMAEVHVIAFPTNIPDFTDFLRTHITVDFVDSRNREDEKIAVLMKKRVTTFTAKFKIYAFLAFKPDPNYRTFSTT